MSLLPDNHQNLAATCVSLGFTYSNQGNYDKAIAFEQKAAAIYRAVYGEEHPKVGQVYSDLAREYKQKVDVEKKTND